VELFAKRVTFRVDFAAKSEKTAGDRRFSVSDNTTLLYTVFQKSDAKIQITITTAHLIRINYPLNTFNYHPSGTNVFKFQQNPQHGFSATAFFTKWNLKTELSNMVNTN